MISFRPFRLCLGRKRPTTSILPIDHRDERDLADLRKRRARPGPPPYDHGAARRAIEARLLAFHELQPQNDAQRAAMLALGEAYSAGLTGPAQDDRIALVLWWCALIRAERGE